MDAKQFGSYIAHLRKQNGFRSQRQLAEVSGISNGTIARIENGTQNPTPKTLETLSKYFEGVSPLELTIKAGMISEEPSILEGTDLEKGLITLKSGPGEAIMFDLNEMLEDKNLHWGSEELSEDEKQRVAEIILMYLSLSKSDRLRAVDLMKIFSEKKDTD